MRNSFVIGVDIVYVPRINEIICSKEKNSFLKRCFSQKEIDEFLKKRGRGAEYLAGRFALKEALVKIAGNRKGIKFSEICCLSSGKRPSLSFYGETKGVFRKYEISFSISHDNEYAFAVAIGRRKR